jgi:hypothetical protein
LNSTIHVELDWKIRRFVELVNCKKHIDEEQSTFESVLNDCIAVGIRESRFAELLEDEYNEVKP